MNTIDVSIEARAGTPTLTANGLSLTAPTGWLDRTEQGDLSSGKHVLGVRPEHVELTAEAARDTNPATVYAVEPLGAEDLITVDIGGRTVQSRMPTGEAGRLPSTFGATVHVRFKHDYLYLFDGASGRTVAQALFSNSRWN